LSVIVGRVKVIFKKTNCFQQCAGANELANLCRSSFWTKRCLQRSVPCVKQRICSKI